MSETLLERPVPSVLSDASKASRLKATLAFLGYREKSVPIEARPWQLAFLTTFVLLVAQTLSIALRPFGPEAVHTVCFWLDMIGLANAAYLVVVAYYPKKALPALYLLEAQPAVVRSGYHLFLRVPNAIWGVITYGMMAVISAVICPIAAYHTYAVWALAALATIGFVFSARLMWAMFTRIGHVCPFCVFSASTMTTVFILTMVHFLGM